MSDKFGKIRKIIQEVLGVHLLSDLIADESTPEIINFLQNFVNIFNRLVEDYKEQFGVENYKPITNIENFFRFWQKKFNLAGSNAKKDVMRTIPNLADMVKKQGKITNLK